MGSIQHSPISASRDEGLKRVEKRTVALQISGKEYRVKSDADEEWLQHVADCVDETMGQIRDRTGMVDTFDIAMLSCLNLAREVITHREARSSSATVVEEDRLKLLTDAAESALDQLPAGILDAAMGSAGGARLRVDQAFEHDSRMPLMIYRFGEFPTEVVWEQDKDLGVTFIEDPDEIERIIGHILPKKSEGNDRAFTGAARVTARPRAIPKRRISISIMLLD